MYLTDYPLPGGQSRGYICRYLFQNSETEAASLHTHPSALPPIDNPQAPHTKTIISSLTASLTRNSGTQQRHAAARAAEHFTQRSISLSGAFHSAKHFTHSGTSSGTFSAQRSITNEHHSAEHFGRLNPYHGEDLPMPFTARPRMGGRRAAGRIFD